MSSLIAQGLVNTHAETHAHLDVHINQVFSLEKASERLRFFPFDNLLHNKFLLWHGLPQTSLVSVLREGLKLPAPEAPSATYRFGKGLYFTDCASKAIVHSVSSSGKQPGEGFVLLCEVALGDMHRVHKPT